MNFNYSTLSTHCWWNAQKLLVYYIGTYYFYVALLDTSGKDKAQPLIVCNLFPVQDEYCNGEKKDEEKNKCIRKRVFIASFFCVAFIALEFAGKLK